MTPTIWSQDGISFRNSTPPNKIRSGESPIKNDVVVAGRYFKPQNKAPFPIVKADRPERAR
jgi:hypothetical protein